MKNLIKNRLFCIIVIFLIFNLGQFLQRKKLILTNLTNLPMTSLTKEKMQKAFFTLNTNKYDIEIKDISKSFVYCDSIIIVKPTAQKNQLYDSSNYLNPVFISDITLYFLITRVENATLAGEDSISNVVYYFWTPWKWYKIRSIITLVA